MCVGGLAGAYRLPSPYSRILNRIFFTGTCTTIQSTCAVRRSKLNWMSAGILGDCLWRSGQTSIDQSPVFIGVAYRALHLE